jgi:RNA polymerase sigma factor (sigma-70 family)
MRACGRDRVLHGRVRRVLHLGDAAAGPARDESGAGADMNSAADAAQSAFVQAYQTWSTIRHPRAWLRTVAVREYYRCRAAEDEILTDNLPDGWEPAADDGLEDRARARAALAAFSQLPPRQREVMSWCRDEFTPAEIARELGIDAAAVRQSIAKARRNLRKLASTWRNA